jgi:dipeptidase D
MSSAIEGLKPELIWKYFAEISRIPRGSKNEAAVAQYVADCAKRLGLQFKIDGMNNVVVCKPGSPGREKVSSVALQGHLDMVCEKNSDKAHDFTKDPIELTRNGNMLAANGTTLGADNGIAVAANLAIMEDRSIEHGPLELVFTVDEETGLTGAANLRDDFLESRILLNLDSEDEGVICVGCAGGRDTIGEWNVQFEAATKDRKPIEVKIAGLKGGHSGIDIDKGRGNAIKIMCRALLALNEVDARLAFIEGGNKRNAIPRECKAIVLISEKNVAAASEIVAKLNAEVKSEFAVIEPDLLISFVEIRSRKQWKSLRKSEQQKIAKTISALPHGVTKMSADIPGLVETSTNVAVVKTFKNRIHIETSQRSSVASELLEIAQSVTSIFELGGATPCHSDAYPGWKPDLQSPVLKLAKASYRSLYKKNPKVEAVHAGLECGVIGERFPGMDMISFGPTLEGVHSPDEKIHIDTVELFWNFLLELLRRIK